MSDRIEMIVKISIIVIWFFSGFCENCIILEVRLCTGDDKWRVSLLFTMCHVFLCKTLNKDVIWLKFLSKAEIALSLFWCNFGLFVLWCLMPLSTIFQFYWWRKVLRENHWPATSHWQTLSIMMLLDKSTTKETISKISYITFLFIFISVHYLYTVWRMVTRV
jgi:hypothetical protein